MHTVAIELKSVSRTEQGCDTALLSDISLQVKQGKLVALVGADGAGKTTLMRVLAGLLKPQQGSVKIFGQDLYEDLSRLQKLCGYMPQKFGLYQDLSVQENLCLYADLFNLTPKVRQQRFNELLSMTDLSTFTERLAGKLSGGMKQKLGLACALLNHPKLLLLDEPSVGVDPLSRQELWRILERNVRDEGMTVLVATTYMDEAAKCDDVIVLEGGKVVLCDSPQHIAEKARGLTYSVAPKFNEKVRDLQAQLLDIKDWVLDAVPQAGYVRVLLNRDGDLELVRAKFPTHKFQLINPTLEDGYLVGRYAQQERSSYSIFQPLKSAVVKSQANPLIVAKEIVRRFGQFEAVKKTSFEVYPGEIFGLLGPNGAGKTTTFKMLCGLLKLSEGVLTIDGIDAQKSSHKIRESLGYVSQKFSLYGDLSVDENLTFFANAYGLFDQKGRHRIQTLMREFRLQPYSNELAKNLPGGAKQRLAMAVALLHQPKILFLDEPTSGADVPTRRQFWRWMTALSVAGTTIIVTTHFMQEAQYCDRLLIQDAGKSLIIGTPEEVRHGASDMDEAFIRIVKDFRQKEVQ